MACRNLTKAEAAKQSILKIHPQADLEIMQIDLASLKSVRNFAKNYLDKYNSLDLLINNAGVMIPPYTVTEDGFELQLGANHLGHFLLTGLLLDTIEATPNSRIVSLSSNAHKSGKINFSDLQSKEKYSAMRAYCQSKLACMMFGYELQRRLELKGSSTLSVVAHPGASDTDLSRHISKFLYYILKPFVSLISHSPANGALPTLMAALKEDIKGGTYYGPQGFQEMKGEPGLSTSVPRSHDLAVAQKLWEVSEALTDIKYL